MNCTEYREALAATPHAEIDGGEAHVAGCADCRALRDDYRTLDARIERALRVPVPPLAMPQLPEVSAADGSVVAIRERRVNRQPWFFGLAAAIALVALLVLPRAPEGTLAEQVIAHMDHEAYSRVVTDVAVPERTLASVVNNEVAELAPGVGLITYARSCVINGREVPHLVIQGERGPVTLLLMPDEQVDAAIPLQGDAINGVILPVGNGSIAVIGEREEPIEDVSLRVADSIRFTT